MTDREVRNEYLFIANSRTSREGDRTPLKQRPVKGKKGIGKFAGLAVSNVMIVETRARGKQTDVTINKDELLKSKKDLEKVDLPIAVNECNENEKGTTITLTHLHQNFTFPNPEKLKEILILDYGRQNNFNVIVNGKSLDVENIRGESFSDTFDIPGVGQVIVKGTLTEKPLKHSGVGIRVDGKLIGKPDAFGIDQNETIPSKLNKRLFVEIEANGLKDDVTADHGAIIENSVALQKIRELIQPKLEEKLRDKFYQEVNLQKARIQKEVNRKLEKLPEHRRHFAEIGIDRVLKKFYNESDERIDTILSVMLDAFEKDDYYEVMRHIDDTKDSDVGQFAEALSEFGLLEMSLITRQAQNRKQFLDYIDRLASNEHTLEKDIHKTLENAFWVFGNNYSLMSSNESLKSMINKFCENKYTGKNAAKRPDLLLSQDIANKYLLVEFKRPSHTVTRDDENQAIKYRDELFAYLGKVPMDIMVIGGKVDTSIESELISRGVKLTTFNALTSFARIQLEWLIKDLMTN
jgi:Histidine kinase-, DNA gyrase B-, and HSP90-like ATPase